MVNVQRTINKGQRSKFINTIIEKLKRASRALRLLR